VLEETVKMSESLKKPAGNIAFSGLEDDYDKARPIYPKEAIKFLCEHVSDEEESLIVDVGCGTGKLTKQLAQNYHNAQVVGCDVNPDMIAKAKATSDGNISYIISPAESLPFMNGEIRLVTVAQAVQWFNRPLFFSKTFNLLCNGGVLGLIENNRNWKQNKFLEDYECLLEEYSPGYSRYYRDHDYEKEMSDAGYLKIGSINVGWSRIMSPEQFIQMSRSSTRMQSALKQHGEKVTRALGKLIDNNVNEEGLLKIHYLTEVIKVTPLLMK